MGTADDLREPAFDADAQLMLRFRDGELSAFEDLFARHARSLVNFAFRFVRNREVAEELAQEIFLRVHDAAPTYRAEARFVTWLYRIATNVCLNETRRPRYRVLHVSLDPSPGNDREFGDSEPADHSRPAPDARLQQQAISASLRWALGQLPEKQRAAFILNKYQELSYTEVAKTMGISEKAVKSLIHRAKEAMAARLRPLLDGLI